MTLGRPHATAVCTEKLVDNYGHRQFSMGKGRFPVGKPCEICAVFQ